MRNDERNTVQEERDLLNALEMGLETSEPDQIAAKLGVASDVLAALIEHYEAHEGAGEKRLAAVLREAQETVEEAAEVVGL